MENLNARGLALTTALIAFGAPSLAWAQSAEEAPPDDLGVCAKAFEQAQRSRNETKYIQANQEALKCANPKCGDALFQECTKLYTDLQDAIPSVVVSARDGNGTEIFDVNVMIDGVAIASDQLDGRPIPMNPGAHKFLFTASNGETVERQVVVRAGEKFRQVSVVIGKPPAAAPITPAPGPSPSAGLDTGTTGSRGVPTASYVLGGIGVLGVGGFIALRAMGASEYDHLIADCAPTCTDEEVDPVRQKYTFSYAALGVGAAALAGAVVIYLAQPSPTTTGASARFVLGATGDGATGRFVAKF